MEMSRRLTMRRSLNITFVGLSVSAVLAVIYTLVMFASLLLVGLGTTRSWQAVFLGFGWSTVAGFEIGLLGVGIVGFAVAFVFVPIYNALQRLVVAKSKPLAQAKRFDWQMAKSWPVRLLAVCLVLPMLTLIALAGALGATPPDAGVTAQAPGSHIQPVALGPVINSAHRETEPSFTADGRTMYFNCNSGDICVSHLIGTWEEGNWTAPELLGAPISTGYEEIEPVINATGDKLYFTSVRPGGLMKDLPFLSPFMNVLRVANTLATARLGRSLFGGLGLADVYVTYRVDGGWSELRNLNEITGEPPINTTFHDHCLFFSADGKEAYWTSTRPGGFGENDIWTSRRVGDQWTQPENLGPNVNGQGSEHSSIPTPDGRSLYVTATRPEGFGEEDIYVTVRGADGAWGPLSNLGPIVNGSGDDRCAAWTPDLKIFLFDSVRDGGFGSRDIWWVYFEDVGDPLAAIRRTATTWGAQVNALRFQQGR
jgi:hypothetical protein